MQPSDANGHHPLRLLYGPSTQLLPCISRICWLHHRAFTIICRIYYEVYPRPEGFPQSHHSTKSPNRYTNTATLLYATTTPSHHHHHNCHHLLQQTSISLKSKCSLAPTTSEDAEAAATASTVDAIAATLSTSKSAATVLHQHPPPTLCHQLPIQP